MALIQCFLAIGGALAFIICFRAFLKHVQGRCKTIGEVREHRKNIKAHTVIDKRKILAYVKGYTPRGDNEEIYDLQVVVPNYTGNKLLPCTTWGVRKEDYPIDSPVEILIWKENFTIFASLYNNKTEDDFERFDNKWL